MLLSFSVFLYGYMLSQFFRSFLAVIAPELRGDLGLNATELGTMSSAWFAAFALAQFPVGAALDRYGPRRTIAVLSLANVAGCILFSQAQSQLAAIVAMALIGLGCAPIFMGALFVFGREYPASQFALLTSWLIATGSLGNLAAATPLSLAVQVIGWRQSFLVLAGLCLIAALLVAVLIRDPVRLTAPVDDGRKPLGLLQVLAIRPLWALLPLIFIGYAIVVTLRGLWIGPQLADVHGLTGVDRGNGALAMAVAMSLGALAYGPLDRWFGTRKWVVAAGTAVTIGGLAALAFASTASALVTIVLFAIVGGFGMTYGVLMAHGRVFLPDHLLGRGMTFLNFLFIGGAGILQIATGLLVDDLRADGLAPAAIYAVLHGVLAVLLAAALVVYVGARERP